MDKLKRIAAIHDISCFGKCSLTVALPIISAMGTEVSIIPTAMLSTHTGGFENYTYRDLTDDITPIWNHFKSLDIKFEALYSGFLGSSKQIDIMCSLFDDYRNRQDGMIFVDPAMADNGKLYDIFDKDFPKEMRKLCEKADVITPNITEAAFLSGKEYKKGPYTREYIEDLINGLSKIGASKIVLTGVYFDNENMGSIAFDTQSGDMEYVFSKYIDGFYPGTGDIFASVLLGALLKDYSITKATQIAVEFIADCIKRTKEAKTDVRYGLNFESGIKDLIKEINK